MAWENYAGQVKSPAEIAAIEAQIAQVPASERSDYQLRMRGITIPAGYRVEPNGKLKYVQVDNNPEEPWYLDAKYVIPAILSGGTAMGLATAPAGLSTITGTGIGTGMGTGPASLAGTSALTAGGGSAALPTIAGTAIGTGMATGVPSLGGPPSVAGLADGGAGGLGGLAKKGVNALTGDGDVPDWLSAVIGGMAGLPALFNMGPTDEERALQAQMQRLLNQQEQRTQFQNPLYEATTRMAFGLLPKMGNNGQPYPLNALSDVQVPGLNDPYKG